MKHFGDIAFTDLVTSEQKARGSFEAYRQMRDSRSAPDGFSENETAFIAARDSFYMATVSETGWPYVQHRGGPTGFLKILSPTQLGFADYRGNRQYVSTGNLRANPRTSLFLMDYANRARLKILGHTTVIDADITPDLTATLAVDGQGRVERLFTIDVEAFDWNCPQFITPRFTEAEVQGGLSKFTEEMRLLRTENAMLKARLEKLEQ
ncbi:MAG: pyridoxamine 5'-phosphate oxidase family protein [Pseudomonadota bacterium]